MIRNIRLGTSGAVVGTVFGLDGKPQPGAKLTLTSIQVSGLARGKSWSSAADGSGKFRFSRQIAPGRYKLEVGWSDKKLRNTAISRYVDVPDFGEHEFDLRPQGTCEIEITTQPLITEDRAYARLTRELDDGKRDPDTPDRYFELRKGRGLARGLAPGRYLVRVDFGGSRKGEVVVDVTAGRRSQALLLLDKR